MARSAVTVETDEAVLLCEDERLLSVQLNWQRRTPETVTMKLRDARSRKGPVITWRFARELLVDGGGIGDVEVLWDREDVLVRFTVEFSATIAIPTDVVQDFLESAAAISPPGAAPSWTVGNTVPAVWPERAR